MIAAFALLVFAELGIYTALGPGLAIALTLVFLVTLTLVPALLAIAGRVVFGGLGGGARASRAPGRGRSCDGRASRRSSSARCLYFARWERST